MSEIFNIYCDESCHLEHDRQSAMVLVLYGVRSRNEHRLPEPFAS